MCTRYALAGKGGVALALAQKRVGFACATNGMMGGGGCGPGADVCSEAPKDE